MGDNTATEQGIKPTTNTTAQLDLVSNPQSLAVAYGSVLIMAMLAIVIGSFRSVSYHQKLKSSGEMPDIASSKDAAMFPFQLSLVLLIVHTMLTQFPKNHAVGKDFLENGLNAKKFLIIGLGDIAFPGIFISLLLRFDMSLKCKSRVYFYSGLAAYGFGFITALLIARLFQHGQPALLYLVPACLVLPTYVAYIKGDIAAMFQYEDYTEAEIVAAAEKEKEK
ncbi:hypothetical protein RRG08_041235 [Elysia crispata]|uniref:Minor histocompatibility antigen H13 n=1 Tax=Elysia crispata TaxID=231223 RepID=A0AAE0YWX2_9GAST|nr:hypothetical protein RRG08_041235 [Elysia crispata]